MNASSSPLLPDALPQHCEGVLPGPPSRLPVPNGWWQPREERRLPFPSPGRPSLVLARVRRMRRCSRALLLWVLGLFAASQPAFVVALDHWHPTLTESWHSHKWAMLRRLRAREPDRPLVVMLGSSRTDDAFDAEMLNGLPGPGGRPLVGFNFGGPMVGPVRQGLYLDEMLRAGIRPSLLLLEFVPALMCEPRRGLVSEENWTLAPWQTLSQIRFMWRYWSHPHGKRRDWLESRLLPWYVFRSPLFTHLSAALFPAARRHKNKDLDWYYWIHDEQGFRIPKCFTLQQFQAGWCGAWTTYAPTLQRFRLGRGSVRALRDLLQRCREEKIPTALVFMPESTPFRNWYRPGALEEAHRLFAELAWEYGALAIDANTWLPDTEFRDGHHAERGGVRVFTTRLIAELRPLLARLRDEDRPAEVAAAGPP